MRIGIVCEGSYPFISGGVSSWVQGLIKGMPQHEFVILAIIPPNQKRVYQYDIPENVTNVSIFQIQMENKSTGKKKMKRKITKNELEQLFLFFQMKNTSRDVLQLIHEIAMEDEIDTFFNSRYFWEIVKRSSKDQEVHNFIEFFYMIKGMYMPIFTLLQNEFPNVELIHSASTGYAGILAAAVASQQGIPYLLTEHGIYTREREEEILLSEWIPAVFKQRWMDYFHHIGSISYHHADHIITLFERNSRVQKEKGAAPEKLMIIPNGVIPPEIVPQSEQRDVFHIGSIVRVVPIKDIKTMLYAARELKNRGISFKWSILGPMDEDKEYAAECLELQEQLGLTEHIALLGKVNVSEYLPNFDVKVLSSLSEGQPLSILEAFSFGVPCISTDVGACMEMIKGSNDDSLGKAGLVFTPTDVGELVEALIWMQQNKEKRKEMGKIGRERVLEFYQQDDVIRSYLELYEGRKE